MSIQWDEEYATGVREIDDQHKRLFEMMGDLERRLGRGEAPSNMMDVLDGLADYAVRHFSFEEGCMERCACPAASVNKLAHQRFVRMVNAAIQDFRTRPPTSEDFEAINREMVNWLTSHICKIDKRLGQHLVAR